MPTDRTDEHTHFHQYSGPSGLMTRSTALKKLEEKPSSYHIVAWCVICSEGLGTKGFGGLVLGQLLA